MINLVKLNFDPNLEANKARFLRAQTEPLAAEEFLTLKMFSVKNGNSKVHHVVLQGEWGYCSCPDFEFRGSRKKLPCKHLFYVHIQGLGAQIKAVAQPAV